MTLPCDAPQSFRHEPVLFSCAPSLSASSLSAGSIFSPPSADLSADWLGLSASSLSSAYDREAGVSSGYLRRHSTGAWPRVARVVKYKGIRSLVVRMKAPVFFEKGKLSLQFRPPRGREKYSHVMKPPEQTFIITPLQSSQTATSFTVSAHINSTSPY